jgi:hypothetical protein
MCAFILKDIYDNASTNLMSSYSITVDGWKGARLDSYVGLTIHYISPRFDLVSKALEVIEVTGSQTGANLEYIRARCSFHFPTATVFGVTCDGGRNYQNASEDVVGKDRRLWCAAHLANLAIHDPCEEGQVSDIIAKVKAIKAAKMQYLRSLLVCLF